LPEIELEITLTALESEPKSDILKNLDFKESTEGAYDEKYRH